MRKGTDYLISQLTSGHKIDYENAHIADLFYLQQKFADLGGDQKLIKEIQDIVIEKYLSIPEEERRYCLGDMDSKDFQIKFLIESRNGK